MEFSHKDGTRKKGLPAITVTNRNFYYQKLINPINVEKRKLATHEGPSTTLFSSRAVVPFLRQNRMSKT
jgi:hypothetical protein